MPYIKIQTNQTLAPETRRELLSKVSQKLAKALGKPEGYVMVDLATGAEMLFAGTDQPAAYVELKSIGLPAVQTPALSKLICTLLEEQAGIDPARIYIEFIDIKGSLWGWNGHTF